jgi:26S proteasome regulatory subunit N7
MAPFYEEVCRDLGWKVDDKLLASMKKANEEKLKQLDEALEDAEKNLGETEIRDSMLSKAEYLSKIGDKVCKLLGEGLRCMK